MNLDSIHSIRRLSDTGLTFVSLFCGAGGMDLGFYKAGFNPILSIDIDKDAINTYRNIFSEHEVHQHDISKFKFNHRADLLIGGPPCQGFSVAGYARPNDPRSKHVHTFMKAVGEIKPRVFVMENVKALAVSPKWEKRREVLLRHAKEIGYEAKFFVLNAADFGVPQRRERMFFIGVRKKNELQISSRNFKRVSVREAFKLLPDYGKPGNDLMCTAKIVVAKKPVIRGCPYSGMFFNGKGRILNLDKPSLTLPASMGGNHTPIIDELNLCEGRQNWAEKLFKILKENKKIDLLPRRLRRLTVQEAAVIQTFPLGIQFSGTVNSQFKQIGNAVPPMLAFQIGKAIREQIFV